MAIDTLILDVLIGFLVGSNLYALYKKNKDHNERREATTSLRDAWMALTKSVNESNALAVELSKRAEASIKVLTDPPPPKNAVRVYAAILKYNNERLLYVAPANSMTEFAETGIVKNGKHWEAEVIQYADCFPPAKEIVRVPVQPNKKEVKALNLDAFVHQLELARDTYTESEYQKKAVDRIIKTVKTRYEHS